MRTTCIGSARFFSRRDFDAAAEEAANAIEQASRQMASADCVSWPHGRMAAAALKAIGIMSLSLLCSNAVVLPLSLSLSLSL